MIMLRHMGKISKTELTPSLAAATKKLHLFSDNKWLPSFYNKKRNILRLRAQVSKTNKTFIIIFTKINSTENR